MLYIERKPSLPLRRFVRSLWYTSAPSVEDRRERMLPSGCAHIVLSLSRDFLTECSEDQPDQRSAPALFVGQRSLYEMIATADFLDLAGVLFVPGAVPVFLGDRADLISNRNLSLDQIWPGYTNYLRSRMLEDTSPEVRLHILENCLTALLDERYSLDSINLHPAVQFALDQFEQCSPRLSIAEIARYSGWSERRFSQVFREQVGFPPKVWHRLQRFQYAVHQLQLGSEVPWAELAVQCGFYDQSHFANEFRAFSGIDLTTYKALSLE